MTTTKEPEVLDRAADEPQGGALAVRPHQSIARSSGGVSIGGAAAMPILSTEEMVDSLLRYKKLQTALDDGMPDQIMELEGKKFRKKGYWRAIAVAFGLSVEPVAEKREVSGLFLDGRENFGYIVDYRATAPNGRTIVADGACFAVEKAKRFKCPHPEQPGSTRTQHWPANTCPDFDADFAWKSLPDQATEHNVRSHAHTRAYNRAVSNLVAFGEVSAEEVDRDGSGGAHEAQPARDAGPLRVKDVRSKPTKNPRVTRYEIFFSDGRKASTIKDKIAEAARALQKSEVEVEPVIEQTQYGFDLVNIAAKDAGMDQRRPETEDAGTQDAGPYYGPERDESAEPKGRELITSTRTITRGGKTIFGIKTTRTEYYTDDTALFETAKTASADETPAIMIAEKRPSLQGGVVDWLVEIQL